MIRMAIANGSKLCAELAWRARCAIPCAIFTDVWLNSFTCRIGDAALMEIGKRDFFGAIPMRMT